MIEQAEKSKPSLKFFNTEKRSKEIFKPFNDRMVRMYTCGPTVYNFAHIGNFRTYIFEDVLRRTLKFFGYKVMQVMNLTDVDDKTIKGAIAHNITLQEYTKPYIQAFFEDLKSLNIEPAEHYPAATDYLEEMIQMIQTLLDKGVAYRGGDGSIYYAIRKFPRYGCLSHLKLEELQTGASERLTADEYDKENASDFVLWKHYNAERDGKIFWESPFGPGRPGWHLECSAMAIKILGESIDIHCGGVDNIFPHHENEIAQSEAYSDKMFVKYWMHAEHLVVENKKMSKSLGNFYTLRDLLEKGFTGKQVRYMLLQTHYKTQLNFSFPGLESVKAALQRLNDFIQRLLTYNKGNEKGLVGPLVQKAYHAFSQALADDLNISVALAAVFELVREVNAISDTQNMSVTEAQEVLQAMREFDSVLGVLNFEKVEEDIPDELQQALLNRTKARENKAWAQADTLRDFIVSKGYLIEDTPEGARLKKIENR
ncbi:Cysteine--tRNA ligase [Neochlamydia sp. AcF95]|nr:MULTISPECIES: cysteine--tRNA ligase [unclassified Neochlamydia]MBS4171505.1 Cysteine--tRNA ligase [Neochlamydia sp. AcF95]